MKWAFNQVKRAINYINISQDKGSMEYLDINRDRIISAINDKNIKDVELLAKRFDLEILTKIKA